MKKFWWGTAKWQGIIRFAGKVWLWIREYFGGNKRGSQSDHDNGYINLFMDEISNIHQRGEKTGDILIRSVVGQQHCTNANFFTLKK